ncbi:replication-associated protein [Wolvfec circovius]|uniref:Replication-associated protein n=1 Tax=Wolvfec circovius TaxID=2817738 RepID=A0AAX1M7X5_9CIRC|nr:replication-associated protein [Wolvfec circovius]QSX73453.1 replication-associated protein [Wolvfec circovius]
MGREAPKRRWCFTINNWTGEELESIKQSTKDIAKYLCIGKEVGKNGTPHLQGYISFKQKKRMLSVKALSGFSRAHLEAAKGTEKEASDYCKKGGDYLEVGAVSCMGQRSDLLTVAETLRQTNGDLKKVAEQCPAAFIRYGRGIRDFCGVMGLGKGRDWKTQVFVYIGPPGCGKTRNVMEECGKFGYDLYFKPRGPWWDGYNGQEAVVLDDFYGWIPYDELLRVCDRYPLRVPVKGGYENFTSKVLFITSNSYPEDWYSSENIRGRIEALFRRINFYRVWGEGGKEINKKPLYSINY